MTKPWSQYQQVVVETYNAVKAGKSSRIHVRPVPGQPFPPSMDVECSRSMRKLYPVGTRFRIYAKETDREGGKPFLSSHFSILTLRLAVRGCGVVWFGAAVLNLRPEVPDTSALPDCAMPRHGEDCDTPLGWLYWSVSG